MYQQAREAMAERRLKFRITSDNDGGWVLRIPVPILDLVMPVDLLNIRFCPFCGQELSAGKMRIVTPPQEWQITPK